MIKNFSYTRPELLLFLVIGIVLATTSAVRASEPTNDKTLVVYYSKTGNTRTACQVIQKALNSDIIEIKDLKNRESTWGIATGMFYSIFGWHTDIRPKSVDLSTYSSVVLAFPIWAGGFPPAMRTFVDINNFEGKEIVVFTTSTSHLDDDKRDAIKSIVSKSNGKVVGHSEVLAVGHINGEEKKKTKQQIASETKALFSDANFAFNSSI